MDLKGEKSHLIWAHIYVFSQSGDRKPFKTDVKQKLKVASLKINTPKLCRHSERTICVSIETLATLHSAGVCVSLKRTWFYLGLVLWGLCVRKHTQLCMCVCLFVCSNFKCLQWHKEYNCILATGELGIFIVLYGWHQLSRNETHAHTVTKTCHRHLRK